MLKGNAIIGQSGGPTAVINASLAGIIQNCLATEAVENVYGMRYGIEGFMKGDVIDLGAEDPAVIEGLRSTPSSALGSCRHKLQDEDFPAILEKLKKYNIRYYFLIGGNDTMDTICRVEAYCKEQGYDLVGVGVPKTVDNDLFGTDHTPGFGSAGRYVATSVKQAGMLARDMKHVDQYVIFQTVGRSAGWLPAAAAMAKTAEDDAPHIILLPERAFDEGKFLRAVMAAYDKYGWCSIVCGEGVCYADGRPISASTTADKFANVEFGAMGGTSAANVRRRPGKPTRSGRGPCMWPKGGRSGHRRHQRRDGEHRSRIVRSIQVVAGHGPALGCGPGREAHARGVYRRRKSLCYAGLYPISPAVDRRLARVCAI